MNVFDPLDPLAKETIKLHAEQIEIINSWFDENAKPQLVINEEEEPTNAVTVEQLLDFMALKLFHRRSYADPSYGEIMKLVDSLNMTQSRMLTKEQFLYILNKFVLLPELKHELKLAFKVFDTEERGYLELDDLTGVLTNLGNIFTHEELIEFLRDANVKGDGNVLYEEFVESMFSVAPELYQLKAEYLYEDPDEDPSVPPLPPEPETEPEPEPPPPPPPKKKKKGGKKNK